MSPADDASYRLGREVLGPAFRFFGAALLKKAREQGLSRLVFVARDGFFLQAVTAATAHQTGVPLPRLDYVYLSRISTSLAAEQELSVQSLTKAAAIRGGTRTVAALFAYFGLDANLWTPLLARHGLTPAAAIDNVRQLEALLGNTEFQATVSRERAARRDYLLRYLDQEGLFDNPHCALVDIGWRATIPHALLRAFPEAWRSTPLRVLQLGHWSGAAQTEAGRICVHGLLGDHQRGRTMLESAPWQLAFLFEALCRADHGTVIGYTAGANGNIVPVLTNDAPIHSVSQPIERNRDAIRRGVLDGIVDAANLPSPTRCQIQRQLLRLAYFPSPDEWVAAGCLTHSEGHLADSSTRLIREPANRWYLAPRPWLRGLASPWRAGYVRATAGRLPVTMLFFLDTVLIHLPYTVRTWIERGVRHIARLS